MTTTIAARVIGPTYALSVANTAHAAVAILDATNGMEPMNYAEFVNPGSTDICVVLAPLPATGTAAVPTVVFPVDATPTTMNTFMLPHGMTLPIVKAVPGGNGFSMGAIGSAAGPSIIYVTPVAPQ